jgi:hypothetical protein
VTRSLRTGLLVALPLVESGSLPLVAPAAAAQQADQPPATNGDFSAFTRLRENGYPAKTASAAMSAEEAPLDDGDIVIGVEIGAEARAYPLGFLWGPKNEVINDTVGGTPVAPSWCPLSHSGVVYSRRLGERVLKLGARGAERGALLLYDAETQSTWSQLAGTAVSGTLAGQRLEAVPSVVTTWGRWRTAHPKTTVYVDPLESYSARYTAGSFAAMAHGDPGAPARPEDWVVGIDDGAGGRAFLVRRFAAARIANDEAGGRPIALVLQPDGATLRAFRREAAGKTLTMRWQGERLLDAETESAWDAVTGKAVSGPLAGSTLEPVKFSSALFYAWKAYRPQTSVAGGTPAR